MVLTKKFSEFNTAVLDDINETVVGVEDGTNVKSQRFLNWTTATRPATPYNGLLGINTDLQQYEYWNATAGDWIQLSIEGLDILALLASHVPGEGASLIGLQNQSNVTDKTVQDLADAAILLQSSNGTLQNGAVLTAGSGVSLTPGAGTLTVSATGSGGTVTSITAGTGITLTPNPITSTGTVALTTPVTLTNGGTGASLTASNGGIFYSTALAGAILAGTATARQMLQSGATAPPAWSTSTWPATTTINQILYSSAANTVTGLATLASATLITSAGGVPSLAQTLPTAVQSNITQLGVQTQALDMGNNFIHNVIDPISPQDAATKNYVDQTSLNGTSVYAASAGSLGTVTQSGAGIGATLTNAGVQATFALDGINPPAGSSVLIKDTATGMTSANEGIYSVTDVGSAGTNWILTRSSSYDTAPEINNTGLIVIQNGSTLAGQAWYNTTTIVAVDTTAFNFVRFGTTGTVTSISAGTGITLTPNPITSTGTVALTTPVSLANGGTNASLVASNGGIFYSTGTAGAILAGTATANQMLQSGASTTPAWSTSTWPATTTANQLLYSSSNNVVAGLTSANNGLLVTSNTGVPSILAGPGATGRILQSNAAAAPSFSTATYPSTAGTAGTILRSDGTNWINSTPTYPTGAPATGTIMVGDGTNYIQSTLTYPASGTWIDFTPTVTLVGGAGNTVPTYSTNFARYTRIGNAILLDIVLFNAAGGTAGAGTGVYNIALPFASNAGELNTIKAAGWLTNGASTFPLYATINAGASTVTFFTQQTATTILQLTGVQQNNASRQVNASFFYTI